MIYNREERYGKRKGSIVEKKSIDEVTDDFTEIDFENMHFFKLKQYAQEQGVDTEKYRTKKEILAQLTK